MEDEMYSISWCTDHSLHPEEMFLIVSNRQTSGIYHHYHQVTISRCICDNITLSLQSGARAIGTQFV